MIWILLCLTVIVHASLIPKESSIEVIQADRSTSPLFQNISFILNASSLGRPLIPGQGPEVTLIRAQAPRQALPPGAMGHHLLSIVQLYWRRADNAPLTTQIRYRDDDFRDILSQITPEPLTRMFTPLNLARGFDIITKRLFREHEYGSSHFRWYYRDVRAGDTKTATLFSSAWEKANQTEVELTTSDDKSSIANAPPVRTRFTGTAMEAGQVLILMYTILTKIWEHAENDPVTVITTESRTIVIVLMAGKIKWNLRLDFLESSIRGGPITCFDISNRLLRALQLPAYLERWETLNSDFFIGEVKIASVSIYQEDDDAVSKTAKRQL